MFVFFFGFNCATWIGEINILFISNQFLLFNIKNDFFSLVTQQKRKFFWLNYYFWIFHILEWRCVTHTLIGESMNLARDYLRNRLSIKFLLIKAKITFEILNNWRTINIENWHTKNSSKSHHEAWNYEMLSIEIVCIKLW